MWVLLRVEQEGEGAANMPRTYKCRSASRCSRRTFSRVLRASLAINMNWPISSAATSAAWIGRPQDNKSAMTTTCGAAMTVQASCTALLDAELHRQ